MTASENRKTPVELWQSPSDFAWNVFAARAHHGDGAALKYAARLIADAKAAMPGKKPRTLLNHFNRKLKPELQTHSLPAVAGNNPVIFYVDKKRSVKKCL